MDESSDFEDLSREQLIELLKERAEGGEPRLARAPAAHKVAKQGRIVVRKRSAPQSRQTKRTQARLLHGRICAVHRRHDDCAHERRVLVCASYRRRAILAALLRQDRRAQLDRTDVRLRNDKSVTFTGVAARAQAIGDGAKTTGADSSVSLTAFELMW
mgnify:CR=1 FL=1